MCSAHCPYLPKQSYYDKDENNSRKPFKNKKLMVNLIGGNREFKERMRKNENFVMDCKLLRNADLADLTSSKDGKKRRKKMKLFGKDGGESKSSTKDCKHCSKNYKTKNVLKIKKAILTQEPPMILVSPDLEKCKIRCSKGKQKKWRRKSEICCEDCCPSADGGSGESSDSFECPCSTFAASTNARCSKLCQTEIPRK